MVITDIKQPVTFDNTSGDVLRTPSKKIDLANINDVRLEMATVYRGMKGGTIETSDGSRLVFTLSAIAKLMMEHDIEMRLELLERTIKNRSK
jgi:hypothetical protein